jgi:hypothetical protein
MSGDPCVVARDRGRSRWKQVAKQGLVETPTAKAIGYALNRRVALQRFLNDGRLPMDNNGSELGLRREAVGRRNWLFVGTDDAAEINASFVSLLASRQPERPTVRLANGGFHRRSGARKRSSP